MCGCIVCADVGVEDCSRAREPRPAAPAGREVERNQQLDDGNVSLFLHCTALHGSMRQSRRAAVEKSDLLAHLDAAEKKLKERDNHDVNMVHMNRTLR